MGIDLDIKFNRALALALIERDIVEANALYRQYLSYLKSLGETNEIKSEIQNTKLFLQINCKILCRILKIKTKPLN